MKETLDRGDIVLRWDMYGRTITIDILRGNSNIHGIAAEKLRAYLAEQYPTGIGMTPKVFRQMQSMADMYLAEFARAHGYGKDWDDRCHGSLMRIEIGGIL